MSLGTILAYGSEAYYPRRLKFSSPPALIMIIRHIRLHQCNLLPLGPVDNILEMAVEVNIQATHVCAGVALALPAMVLTMSTPLDGRLLFMEKSKLFAGLKCWPS